MQCPLHPRHRLQFLTVLGVLAGSWPFLVDVAEIDALWRILVCITGGITFLLLGCFLPRMTARQDEP